MRILIITPTYFPIAGGAERGIHEICQRLAQRHNISLLTPRPDPYYYRFYRAQGEDEYFWLASSPTVSIFRFKDQLNLMRWQAKRRYFSFLPPFSLSAIQAAFSLAKSFKPELIISFYSLPTGLAAVVLKKIFKIPLILSLIGRDVPGPGVPPFWKKYVRLVAHQADQIIFISHYCQQALGPIKGIPAHIIPFGINLEDYSKSNKNFSLRQKFGITGEAPITFCLQRLDPWKKTEIIVEAFHYLVKSGEKIYLLIGGRGQEEELLRKRIHQLNLENYVFMAGFIPEREIPSFFLDADIFCFHSIYETFGLVLLQAMAAGKPIVTVRSTAIPELIEDGKTGLLVDPLNPKAMAKAIGYLIKNWDLAKKLGEQAKEKAQFYSWERVSEQYEQIIRQVIAKKTI